MAINPAYAQANTAVSAQAADVLAHRAMAAPWVVGSCLQCIFTGIILYQAQRFATKAQRKHLSTQLQAFIAVLLFLNFLSSALEMRVLWWFAMFITGSNRASAWPVSLSMDLVVNPFAMVVCQAAQSVLAYKVVQQRRVYLWLVLPLLLLCFLVSTTLSTFVVLRYVKPALAAFYLDIASAFGGVFGVTLLLLWTGNTIIRLRHAYSEKCFSSKRLHDLPNILGQLLSTGVLAIIPLLGLATVIFARLFPTTPAIVFNTITPRILAMSILASLSDTLHSTSTETKATNTQHGRSVQISEAGRPRAISDTRSFLDLEKFGSTVDSGCEITLEEMFKSHSTDKQKSGRSDPEVVEEDITLARP